MYLRCAGVMSASMKVYVIENVTHGNKTFSNLNEGYGKVLRYGAYSEEVLAKLHWMNDTLGTILAEALALSEDPITAPPTMMTSAVMFIFRAPKARQAICVFV